MDYEVIEKTLAQRLSAKRYKHSMGVSKTAVSLAERFGGDVNKARIAGILHDCAREVPRNILLQRAEAFGIVVGEVEQQEPVLLHAPVGAELARREYGIKDADICRAIVWHTVGGPEMTLLDIIIYLADFIEPGRSFPGVDKLRLLAEKDLDAALLAAYDQTLQYIVEKGGLIHPATVAGRNSLLIKLRSMDK